MYSVVEEAQVGMHKSDSQLVAGVDDHLVSGGAGRSGNVLHTTLKHVYRKPLVP